ncbi:hypothetical protein NMU76_02345 [Pasteurella multocida]|nr:hypothetical protein [Pasteurella multocida]MDY0634729.1 hypothetical protein [Pasteurella multocida]MDY0692080.1 hypothetical protein [Pasteurella multocida]
MLYSNLSSNKAFHVLCAAMDTFSDTQDAMFAYMNLEVGSKYTGIEYVYAYGILNILEVQQDVLKVIFEFLTQKNLKIDSYQNLKEIRKIRNDVFGHSVTYKKRDEIFKGIVITRYNLSVDYFEAIDFSKFGTGFSNKYKVSIKELIKLQTNDVDKILSSIINYLEKDNEEYIKIMREDSKQEEHKIKSICYNLEY